MKVLVAQSCLTLFNPMDYIAHQTPLSLELSRQEYWSGWPFLSPGDHPNLGIEPTPPASPALAGRFFTTEPSSDSQSETSDQQDQLHLEIC